MALFLFGIQVATGILLSLYYKPSPDQAFESVRAIMTEIDFGWLIRSVHVWSANLLIGVLFLHILTTYMMRAYRGPREITWITGVLLLGLFLAFGFSGYLLPWNQLAFFATRVGTAIMGRCPWSGKYLLLLARSGENVTGDTLARFYALHVVILPLCAFALIGLHLFLVQKHGMSVPERRGQAVRRGRQGARRCRSCPISFCGTWSAGTWPWGCWRPWPRCSPGNWARRPTPSARPPQGSSPSGISSSCSRRSRSSLRTSLNLEWLEGEMAGVLFFGFCGLVVLVVPFLDFGAGRRWPRRVLNVLAVLAVAFFIVMSARGLSDPLDAWFSRHLY